MAESSELDRVWDIILRVGAGMLTTCFEGGLRARPVEARPDRSSVRLLFVTDIHSAKRHEIDRRPDVGLVFVDASDNAYLSSPARRGSSMTLHREPWHGVRRMWCGGLGDTFWLVPALMVLGGVMTDSALRDIVPLASRFRCREARRQGGPRHAGDRPTTACSMQCFI